MRKQLNLGNPERDIKIMAARMSGKSLGQIAKEHGITRQYVSLIVKRNGRNPLSIPTRRRVLELLEMGVDARFDYGRHKSNAKARGIEFSLTFEQWLDIWGDKILDRGPGKLVMCRTNDSGPYAVGNVRIAPQAENLQEWKDREFSKNIGAP